MTRTGYTQILTHAPTHRHTHTHTLYTGNTATAGFSPQTLRPKSPLQRSVWDGNLSGILYGGVHLKPTSPAMSMSCCLSAFCFLLDVPQTPLWDLTAQADLQASKRPAKGATEDVELHQVGSRERQTQKGRVNQLSSSVSAPPGYSSSSSLVVKLITLAIYQWQHYSC